MAGNIPVLSENGDEPRMTGVSVAVPTIYDMCKALTHNMASRDVRLLGKRGGRRDFGDIVGMPATP